MNGGGGGCFLLGGDCYKELETAQRVIFCYVRFCSPNSFAVMGLFVIDQLVGRLLQLEMEI